MRFWNYVETREVGPFTVILDWTYEDTSVRDMFDETEEKYQEMERRLNSHLDTHYVARVRALFEGHELGSNSLGSCYAYDCDPAEDMTSGISGYLEDMIAAACSEADAELKKLKEKIALIA